MAGSSDSEGEGGVESRSKMLKRHKKEVIAAQKAQKALGKKRADEGAALVAEVNARHAAELAALDARPAGEAAADAAPAADAPAAAEGLAAATAALASAALSDAGPAASDAGGKARAHCAPQSAALASAAHRVRRSLCFTFR
jgi:OTU domain-containing protein 6